MRTRHFAIIAILLCVIMSYYGIVSAQSPSNDLSNGSLLSFTTTKSAFSAGDVIDIHGNSLPNYNVELTLVGPNGTIQDSRATFSDRDGQFSSYLLMPKYAQGGIWKILGKSGTYNNELDFDIFEPQPGTCQGCFLPELNKTVPTVAQDSESPLEQFKSGISANNVLCKEGVQLVIKAEDGSPACVKPDNAYTLIYRGWAREFIQSIAATSQSTCDGTPVPNGEFRKNIFPVLIMSPNSTATVCVTYNFELDWQSYQNKQIYFHGILETCCFVHPGWYSSPASSNKFDILANPPLFNVTGVYSGSKISVTYKIYAKPDSNGFYDTSVPFDGCLSYPLAVGYNPSEIDATKFHADFDIPCFASIEDVDSVNIVSGMTYKEVQFP